MSERYGDVNVWPAVHNSWILAWTEQGTIGFLLWVLFHFSVIAEGVRNLRIRDPMMHALSVGLLAGFVAIMIDGLASFFVRTEAPARMFWIATGLILAIGYWRREGEPAALAVAGLPGVPEPRRGGPPAGGGRWLPGRESALR
jgi:O-antigen ligase